MELAVGYVLRRAVRGGQSDPERRIREYCAAAGIALFATVTDAETEAVHYLRDREHGRHLLGKIEEGTAHNVVAADLSSIFTDAVDAAQCLRAWTGHRPRIHFHLALLGDAPYATRGDASAAKLFRRTVAGLAQLAKDDIGRRVQDGMWRAKIRGKALSATTPYGYRREGDLWVELPDEQAVIATMRDMRARGYGWSAIATYLNTNGIKAKQGGKWWRESVRSILTRALPNSALNPLADLQRQPRVRNRFARSRRDVP